MTIADLAFIFMKTQNPAWSIEKPAQQGKTKLKFSSLPRSMRKNIVAMSLMRIK
jgi:hypothetical protein